MENVCQSNLNKDYSHNLSCFINMLNNGYVPVLSWQLPTWLKGRQLFHTEPIPHQSLNVILHSFIIRSMMTLPAIGAIHTHCNSHLCTSLLLFCGLLWFDMNSQLFVFNILLRPWCLFCILIHSLILIFLCICSVQCILWQPSRS